METSIVKKVESLNQKSGGAQRLGKNQKNQDRLSRYKRRLATLKENYAKKTERYQKKIAELEKAITD